MYSDMTYLRNLHADLIRLRGEGPAGWEDLARLLAFPLKLQVPLWNFPLASTQSALIFSQISFWYCFRETVLFQGVMVNLWFSVFDRKTVESSDLVV